MLAAGRVLCHRCGPRVVRRRRLVRAVAALAAMLAGALAIVVPPLGLDLPSRTLRDAERVIARNAERHCDGPAMSYLLYEMYEQERHAEVVERGERYLFECGDATATRQLVGLSRRKLVLGR